MDSHVIKQLYNRYSPLKTKKSLLEFYNSLTSDYSQDLSNIRETYNNLIKKYFINESVIKAAFINNFCFNKSPRNNVTIFELNSSNSRADLCMINGSSIVFEIKTEYDTLQRLDKQINDYETVFDYINVIIPIQYIEPVRELLPVNVGIITYKQNRLGNVSFEILREPTQNLNTNPVIQLNQLSKKEILKYLRNKELSELPKQKLIEVVKETKTSEYINKMYKIIIKQRYKQKWTFLCRNKDEIYFLDYQWFFKNNLPADIVYK